MGGNYIQAVLRSQCAIAKRGHLTNNNNKKIVDFNLDSDLLTTNVWKRFILSH